MAVKDGEEEVDGVGVKDRELGFDYCLTPATSEIGIPPPLPPLVWPLQTPLPPLGAPTPS
ncbi:hypothetical protein PGTUg99_017865 [Puccinia graminis f. sp. tritici]|uniref:Uncharacterized protein n=1 Tax=Puccinia graminis f. sp. tritici TaxID=56615 RepID=A0A5B0R5Z8_PUCGR|nr:hypothetical protein PGTUg99_017865 [Puccinia graminis f. sp. tritici]